MLLNMIECYRMHPNVAERVDFRVVERNFFDSNRTVTIHRFPRSSPRRSILNASITTLYWFVLSRHSPRRYPRFSSLHYNRTLIPIS